MSDKASIAAQPQTTIGNATFIEGGLGAVKGLRCSGVYAGFRRNPGRKDLALVVTNSPAVASAVFTKNTFSAAPVCVSRKHLASMSMADVSSPKADEGLRAIILNSGNHSKV